MHSTVLAQEDAQIMVWWVNRCTQSNCTWYMACSENVSNCSWFMACLANVGSFWWKTLFFFFQRKFFFYKNFFFFQRKFFFYKKKSIKKCEAVKECYQWLTHSYIAEWFDTFVSYMCSGKFDSWVFRLIVHMLREGLIIESSGW